MNTFKIAFICLISFLSCFAFSQEKNIENDSLFEKILSRKMEKLSSKLNLSQEQAIKVKQVFLATRQKIKSIKQEEKKLLAEILNAEQIKKIEMRKERMMQKIRKKLSEKNVHQEK